MQIERSTPVLIWENATPEPRYSQGHIKLTSEISKIVGLEFSQIPAPAIVISRDEGNPESEESHLWFELFRNKQGTEMDSKSQIYFGNPSWTQEQAREFASWILANVAIEIAFKGQNENWESYMAFGQSIIQGDTLLG